MKPVKWFVKSGPELVPEDDEKVVDAAAKGLKSDVSYRFDATKLGLLD
ncbi:hypothetical protein ACFOQM_13980 [Paenibacillus sp. GCM10012307]